VYSASPSLHAADESVQEPWHDTHIQIEGPAVAEFQKLFLETWEEQNGPELEQKNYFPVLKKQGKELVRVVGSTPGEMNRLTYIMYVCEITFAKKTIHLTNAYFVPDDQIIKAITDAARGGLDVKIILPGKSDMELALYSMIMVGRNSFLKESAELIFPCVLKDFIIN
jgi:cardiolipin synthase A/B